MQLDNNVKLAYNVFKYIPKDKKEKLSSILNKDFQILLNLNKYIKENDMYIYFNNNTMMNMQIFRFISLLNLSFSDSDKTNKKNLTLAEINFRKGLPMQSFMSSYPQAKGKKLKLLLFVVFNQGQNAALYLQKDTKVIIINSEGKFLSNLEKCNSTYQICELQNNILAISSKEKNIKIWDVKTLTVLKTITLGADAIHNSKQLLKLDKYTLMSGNDKGEVRIFNTVSCLDIILPFSIGEAKIRRCVKYGSNFIFGFNNGSISIVSMNIRELKQIASERRMTENESIYAENEVVLEIKGKFTYHNAKITSLVKIHYDEANKQQLFCSGCKDGLIIIWSMNSKIHTYHSHLKKVYSILHYSLNNNHILVSSCEKKINLYNIDLEEEVYHINSDSLNKAGNFRFIAKNE